MSLLHDRRRKKNPGKQLLPDELWVWALEHHPILANLSSGELLELRALTTLFLQKKEFEGAEGLVLDEGIKTSIAVQACLPILKLGLHWYDNWQTTVVVPTKFVGERRTRDRAGVIHEWKEIDVGESWDRGPVVLSWRDVQASGWADGFNVVIHEAAHRLDMTDGSMNGRPALHAEMSVRDWADTCAKAFDHLSRRIERSGRTRINPYATVSDVEFFAVMAEYFFERGSILLGEYPDVYRLFSEFYRQDPAARGAS